MTLEIQTHVGVINRVIVSKPPHLNIWISISTKQI